MDTATAQRFGDAVVARNFVAAHALLTHEAQLRHPPEVMRREVDDMIGYADGPIQRAEVLTEFVVYDWPAKKAGDVASVYVALSGDSFCEAVIVVLTATAEGIRVRELEWGRP